jgi:hypothetical protein
MNRPFLNALASLAVSAALGASIAGPPAKAVANTCQAPSAQGTTTSMNNQTDAVAQHPYVGMWVTSDNRIRHQLLPNGRYDEARGTREGAYLGRYEVTGNRIEYWDDAGFTADGVFVNENELHHGGMILFRRR